MGNIASFFKNCAIFTNYMSLFFIKGNPFQYAFLAFATYQDPSYYASSEYSSLFKTAVLMLAGLAFPASLLNLLSIVAVIVANEWGRMPAEAMYLYAL